jgi:hypothetical protein
MPRNPLHALMAAAFAGALAPGVLVLLRGAASALVWGPSVRIAAFFNSPGQPPGMRITSLALDALIGTLAGALLAWAVVRFARASHWRLALVFLGGFAAAAIVLLLFAGDSGFASSVLRRPLTPFFLVAAAGSFWLFPRPAK